IRLSKVIEAMTQNRENRLHEFELLDEDWDIITQLKDIFKQATLLFSVKDTPNLANVIPVMDSIDSALSLSNTEKKYNDSICLSVSLARQTLNRYYSKTDTSDTYQVAMLLHPRYKSVYWKEHDWETKWIAIGIKIAHRIYDLPKYATTPDARMILFLNNHILLSTLGL
ncbi:hypothetical protein BS47DRAFT_1300392, partial [Hydnum rufescens UP504]